MGIFNFLGTWVLEGILTKTLVTNYIGQILLGKL